MSAIVAPYVANSLYEVILARAMESPESAAILGPDQYSLSNAELLDQVRLVAQVLGSGAHDRVGVLMPNGPEMAVAAMAAAACTACAPLNPQLKEAELEFCIDDLGIRTLLLAEELGSDCKKLAEDRRVRVIETARSKKAGQFMILSGRQTPALFRGADDIGLLLHTSGSTAKPKIVPLFQRNLCRSAANIAKTLKLTRADKCLNVMPLFHIHGLVAGVLASMVAGGSVICSRSFETTQFFQLLDECKATWYTAVPTIHQAVLMEAGKRPMQARSLRLIRSSSAALPRPVFSALEATFGVPVIEAYGMTEAAHQIASNELPPGVRKPNSVGIAAGCEIAILNEDGQEVKASEVGEICIRGENVCKGYENNPTATVEAFTQGWFRTGDLGFFDNDGYLFISGRIKEVINRAGEKVSPREVDEVLLTHSDVIQAATFAVPHPTLGEDVFAAVVLRDGAATTDEDLRIFARSHLAEYKSPRQILVVGEMPKSPSGKLQRQLLAETFQELIRPVYVEPRTEMERTLARLWESIFGIEKIGIHDNFFRLGGDSVQAVMVCSRARAIQLRLEPDQFAEHPTIAGLVSVVETIVPASSVRYRTVGECPLLPGQAVFLSRNTSRTGITIEASEPFNPEWVQAAADQLVAHHDGLRTRIVKSRERSEQVIPAEPTPVPVLTIDESCNRATREKLISEQRDIVGGLNIQFLHFPAAGGARIVIVAHHAVADRRSLEILAEDFQTLYEQLSRRAGIVLPEKTTSLVQWAEHRSQQLNSGAFDEDLPFWRDTFEKIRLSSAEEDASTSGSCHLRSGIDTKLLRGIWDASSAWGVPPSSLFATALARAVAIVCGKDSVALMYALSGRRDISAGLDLSRTVACLANMAPVLIHVDKEDVPSESAVRALQEEVENILIKGERLAWLAQRHTELRTVHSCIGYNYVNARPVVAGSRALWLARQFGISPLANVVENSTDSREDATAHQSETSCRVLVGSRGGLITLQSTTLRAPVAESILYAMRENLYSYCSDAQKSFLRRYSVLRKHHSGPQSANS